MTIEGIDLNDPAVSKALEEAGYMPKDKAEALVDEQVKGLKSKNEELLGKLKSGKASQAELIELQSQLKEIEDEKLRAAEDWTALEKNMRKEMEKLKGEYESQNSNLTSALVERDLVSELVKANVAPHFLDAVKAMHRDQIQYNDGKMIVGDQPLSDFVTEWAQSDQGKHFVSAPDNNGGGAPGGRGGSGGSKTITRDELLKMPPNKQRKLVREEGYEVVDE